MRTRGTLLTVALTAAAIGAACGGGNSSSPAPAATTAPGSAAAATSAPTGASALAGTWTGSWKRDSPAGGGGLTLSLSVQGTAITGTLTMVGSACLPKAPQPLQGSVSGADLTFSASSGTYHADFKGKAASGSISGTLKVSCPVGTGTGTWQATKS